MGRRPEELTEYERYHPEEILALEKVFGRVLSAVEREAVFAIRCESYDDGHDSGRADISIVA